MVSDAVRRARKVAEMQNEGQKKGENAEFFSLAYKTLIDPEYQDYQREKDLKSMDNSTPQYVKQIMEVSLPKLLCRRTIPSLFGLDRETCLGLAFSNQTQPKSSIKS
jgi:hypothetical protein